MIPHNSLHELDYMRLFMAITILLGHCVVFGNFELFGDTTMFFNRWLGGMVVPYFFALTVFFLCIKGDILATSKKMAIRLFSLYLIWSLLYIPIHLCKYLLSKDRAEYIFSALKQFALGNFPLWYLWGGVTGIILLVISIRLLKHRLKLILSISLSLFLMASVFKYIILIDKDFFKFIYSYSDFGKFMVSDAFIRNGIFFGFPFITLGVFIGEQYKQHSILGIRTSIAGVLISFIIGIIEVRFSYVISGYDYAATGNQLKIFLVPSTYFLICLLIELSRFTPIKETRNLRKISGLIYFIHFEIMYFVGFALRKIHTSPYLYNLALGGITLLMSIAVSYSIIKASEKQPALKKLF
nr:acyltransferase family protein [Succinivibrio dextrinosolvens]